MTTSRPSDGYGFPFIGSHIAGIYVADVAAALDRLGIQNGVGGHFVRVIYDHMLRLEADQRNEFKKRHGLVPKIGRAGRAAIRRPKRSAPRRVRR